MPGQPVNATKRLFLWGIENMLCCEWTLVKSFSTHLTAEPLKCRRWSCDYCQPYRASDLRRQARDGKPDTFLTLTVNPMVGKDPDHRARTLVRAWRLIRLRAIRKYKYKSIPFIAVFEATKAGEPHLHILCRVPWIDQRWLSRQMAELMSAPICDIRRIKHVGQLANYVAKYVGKDPQAFKRCKRYWASHDYKPAIDDLEDGDGEEAPCCWVEKISIAGHARAVASWGFALISERKGKRTYQNAAQMGAVAPLAPP